MTPTTRSLLYRLAAGAAFLAVALGAFGAHALKDTLAANGHTETWRTAVFYQLTHAIALVALLSGGRITRGQALCFLLGMLFFSGSLYGLSLKVATGVFGPITPLGGVLLLVGWGCVIHKGLRDNTQV